MIGCESMLAVREREQVHTGTAGHMSRASGDQSSVTEVRRVKQIIYLLISLQPLLGQPQLTAGDGFMVYGDIEYNVIMDL